VILRFIVVVCFFAFTFPPPPPAQTELMQNNIKPKKEKNVFVVLCYYLTDMIHGLFTFFPD
jgi:hypothetical protein